MLEYIFLRSQFYHLSKVHHGDTVRDMLHNRKIMGNKQVSQVVFILQIFVGLLTPLLAGLYPVLQGVGIPAARAISQTGLGRGQYGIHLIDRMISSIRRIPRMAALSLRHTFRRPGRVVLPRSF